MTFSCGIGVTLCGETWQLLQAVLCGLPCTFWNLLEHLHIGADLWVKYRHGHRISLVEEKPHQQHGLGSDPKGECSSDRWDSGQDRKELQTVLGRWECSDRCCGWLILTGQRSNSEWSPISKSESIFSGSLQFFVVSNGMLGEGQSDIR